MLKIRKNEIQQYLFLLPVFIVVLVIFAYPYIRNLIYSFYDISFGGAKSNYIGLKIIPTFWVVAFSGNLYGKAFIGL